MTRDPQECTGVSVRRILHEPKLVRDVTIKTLGHDLTAAKSPWPELDAILKSPTPRDL